MNNKLNCKKALPYGDCCIGTLEKYELPEGGEFKTEAEWSKKNLDNWIPLYLVKVKGERADKLTCKGKIHMQKKQYLKLLDKIGGAGALCRFFVGIIGEYDTIGEDTYFYVKDVFISLDEK